MKQNPNESQIRFLIAKEQKQGKLEQAEQNLLNRLTKEGQKMRGVKDAAGHGPGDRRARLHRALDKVLNAKMGGPKRQAMDEVPDWPGAASVYKRLYSALDKMRENGHVSAGNFGKGLRGSPGTVSQEMRDIISHLNEGNEQKLKADIHWCMSRGYL